jgi:hypothetical protein
LGDFAARLQDDKLLAGDQSEDRVGCGLGIFDEVAVNRERASVEPCQFDHVVVFLPGLSSAEKSSAIAEIGDDGAKVEQL